MLVFNSFQQVYDANTHVAMGTASVMSVFNGQQDQDKRIRELRAELKQIDREYRAAVMPYLANIAKIKKRAFQDVNDVFAQMDTIREPFASKAQPIVTALQKMGAVADWGVLKSHPSDKLKIVSIDQENG